MTLITIREHVGGSDSSNATIRFDLGEEYPIAVHNPFTEEQEKRLEWYFEHYLYQPYVHQREARLAAESITRYGETLFERIFASHQVYARYSEAKMAGIGTMRFEIVGSPEFHRIHWEALKDPKLPRGFSLEVPIIRTTLSPHISRATLYPSPTLNMLIVTARPFGDNRGSCRTIARPLVDGIRRASLPVQVEILRPGSFQELARHLTEVRELHGMDYYHVIHIDAFDGWLSYEELTSESFLPHPHTGREEIDPFDGTKPFLFFEGEREGQADAVPISELATLLVSHHLPMVLVTNGQTMQSRENGRTQIGCRLMHLGVQSVLTTEYTLSTDALQRLVQVLYEHVCNGSRSLSSSLQHIRQELAANKVRYGLYHQEVYLEDWVLPVLYQNKEQPLGMRSFTPDEQAVFSQQQTVPFCVPETTYGFVGRDLDIIQVERRLKYQHNMILVEGKGGVGKTTFLRYLASWWQTTRFIDEIFYFGYHTQAWMYQDVMNTIAQRLFGATDYYHRIYQTLSTQAQQAVLTRRLRTQPHVLIFDSLESISGSHLAPQNALQPEERALLRRFLVNLAAGRTIVLFGSREDEEWLTGEKMGQEPLLTPETIYTLKGLDYESSTILARRIVEKHHIPTYYENDQTRPDFENLIGITEGHPLALDVLITQLHDQTPGELLNALRIGTINLKDPEQSLSSSLLHSVECAYGSLSRDIQTQLVCLAPFTSVVNQHVLDRYTEYLQQEPFLEDLSPSYWQRIFHELTHWGLLEPHPSSPTFLRFGEIFSYILRLRANQRELVDDMHIAFRKTYSDYGNEIWALLQSKDPEERQQGQTKVALEYRNLMAALDLLLDHHESALNVYKPLAIYLNMTREYQQGIELAASVQERIETHFHDGHEEPHSLNELAHVLHEKAICHYALREYDEARTLFSREVDLIQNLHQVGEGRRKWMLSSAYHYLGHLAQEKRQWEEAEGYYRSALEIEQEQSNRANQAAIYRNLGHLLFRQRQWTQSKDYYQHALDIYTELNEPLEQANIYHNMGMVEQDLRQWKTAEQYHKKALSIYNELKDRHHKAKTFHQLGSVSQAQRQWDHAEAYYHKMLEIFTDLNDRYHQAIAYHQLGSMSQARRLWTQAEYHYRRALKIFVSIHDRYGQANTYSQLGALAQAQRQWAQAKDYYQQVVQIFIDLKDRHNEARTYHQLGMVAQAQRLWTQAESYYQQALKIFIDLDEKYEQAGMYNQLGILARAQRLWHEAEHFYQQSLQIFIDVGDKYEQAGIYHQLGIVSQAQQQWERAEDYSRKALDIYLERDDRERQANIYGHLGVLARAQDQWEHARDYFLHALERFVANGDSHSAGITLGDLAWLWRENNDTSLPDSIAAIMGVSAERVEERLRQVARHGTQATAEPQPESGEGGEMSR
jgi:tetratricopeptide (TPR) repeat protein